MCVCSSYIHVVYADTNDRDQLRVKLSFTAITGTMPGNDTALYQTDSNQDTTKTLHILRKAFNKGVQRITKNEQLKLMDYFGKSSSVA